MKLSTSLSKTRKVLLVFILANSVLVASQQSGPKNKTAQQQVEQVEDLVKSTMQLLDVLDERLDAVQNRTPTALMHDNLRALDESQQESAGELLAARAERQLTRLADEELVRFAESFSSGRKSAIASAQQQVDSIAVAPSNVVAEVLRNDGGDDSLDESSDRNIKRQERQLHALEEVAAGNQIRGQHQLGGNGATEYDSTDRHLQFTLNLMQAIFASQGYSAKTSSLESFLISPVSIQTVLMMMHLGARGQTRRELANCLNLLSANGAQLPSQLPPPPQTDESGIVAKLKRRQSASAAKPSAPVVTTTRQLAQQSNSQNNNLAHEQFGAATKNLLKDPTVTKSLTSANRILVQKSLPLASQYEWATRQYYAADLKSVDFQNQLEKSSVNATRPAAKENTHQNGTAEFAAGNNVQQMINEFVERQTKGKISNFLSAPVPTSTLLMAINVLFFKGDWQYKFDPNETQTESLFTLANGKIVKTPMMVSKLPLAFAHDPNLKATIIELPYKAQRLGLFILLPDEISGIFHTMQQLNSTSFANLISSMRKPTRLPDEQGPSGINVRIPKFSIDSTPRLSQILSQQLGLKTLFSPDLADLSGIFASPTMSPARNKSSLASLNTSSSGDNQFGGSPSFATPAQVGLDELLHKAVLQVHEQGSVAAASSATIAERVGYFNSPYFEADHPFLLFLMDKQTGLVLFSGAYAGPNDTPIHSGGSSSNRPGNATEAPAKNTPDYASHEAPPKQQRS